MIPINIIKWTAFILVVVYAIVITILFVKNKNTSLATDTKSICDKYINDLSTVNKQLSTCKSVLTTQQSTDNSDQIKACNTKLGTCQGQTLKEFLNTNNATQGNGVWLNHNVKSSADAEQMCKLAGYKGALSQNDYVTFGGNTERHGDSWWGPSTKIYKADEESYVNYGYLEKNGNWSFAKYRVVGTSALKPVCVINSF